MSWGWQWPCCGQGLAQARKPQGDPQDTVGCLVAPAVPTDLGQVTQAPKAWAKQGSCWATPELPTKPSKKQERKKKKKEKNARVLN